MIYKLLSAQFEAVLEKEVFYVREFTVNLSWSQFTECTIALNLNLEKIWFLSSPSLSQVRNLGKSYNIYEF